MRGFEDTAWFPKTLKPSSSVAARRCEGAPIFAKGACGALVGTFSHQILGVKIRKLLSDLAHFILTPGVLVPSFPLPYITPLHAGVGVGRGLLGQYALVPFRTFTPEVGIRLVSRSSYYITLD